MLPLFSSFFLSVSPRIVLSILVFFVSLLQTASTIPRLSPSPVLHDKKDGLGTAPDQVLVMVFGARCCFFSLAVP